MNSPFQPTVEVNWLRSPDRVPHTASLPRISHWLCPPAAPGDERRDIKDPRSPIAMFLEGALTVKIERGQRLTQPNVSATYNLSKHWHSNGQKDYATGN